MRPDLLAMARRAACAWSCALAAPLALAQAGSPDPDWKEIDAPPPPAWRAEKLIELEVPRATMRFALDPASVSVGRDGVVRYVVIASVPGGAVNGLYEGIRCNTGEVKVFARHNGDGGWKPVASGDWRPIHEGAARHSLYVARNGACVGHGANGNAAQIVRDLAASVDRRYSTDSMR